MHTHGSESSLATIKMFSNSRRHCSKFRRGMWKKLSKSFSLTWGWRSWKQCWMFTRRSGFSWATIDPPVHESFDVPTRQKNSANYYFFDTLSFDKFFCCFDFWGTYRVYYAAKVMYLIVNLMPFCLKVFQSIKDKSGSQKFILRLFRHLPFVIVSNLEFELRHEIRYSRLHLKSNEVRMMTEIF